MNNTLLLHIGMPKTGTTALQNFLWQNNGKLQKYGWCYPALSDDEMTDISDIEDCGNASNMYYALIAMNNKQEWNKGMAIALRHLKKNNVILSTEGIAVDGIDQFITSAKERYENIKVVIYLRRQDREVESLYNQFVKIGREQDAFHNYLESNADFNQYICYLSKLDSISQIIGKENLIVRIYEKQQLVGNDIVTDFLSVLGIPPVQEEWAKTTKMNLSMRGNYLEIRRLINSLQRTYDITDDNDYIWKVMQSENFDIGVRLSRSYKDKSEHGFFTMEERKEFLGRFTEENKQIAREYLHREDGRLFYDDIVDYPLYTMKQDNSFEADMIRMFAAMFYRQKQEFHCLLEKNSREMMGKFLMKDVIAKSDGRKLLIFGAGYKCRKLFDAIKDISPVMIVDNDIAKDGTFVNGVQVKYAKDIVDWWECFIVVTCEKTDEIEEQLHNLGLKKTEDYFLMKEYGL